MPTRNQSTSHRIETRVSNDPFKDTSLYKFFHDVEYAKDMKRIPVFDWHFEPWNANSKSTVLGNQDNSHGVVITIVLNAGAIMVFLTRGDVATIQHSASSAFWPDHYQEIFKDVYIGTKDGTLGKLAKVLAEAQRDFETDCLSLELWDFRIQMSLSQTENKGYMAPDLMRALKTDFTKLLNDYGASIFNEEKFNEKITEEDIEEVPVDYMWENSRKLSAIVFERFPKSMSKFQNDARYRVLLGAQYKLEESKAVADPAIVKPKYLTLIFKFWNISPRA